MSLTRSSTTSRPSPLPTTRDPRLAEDRTDRFEAFYESWYPRAVSMARRRGIPDPEAAAQDCMLVFHTSDYLDQYFDVHKDCAIPDPVLEPHVKAVHVGHDSAQIAKLDTWVGNILYRRMVSHQRKNLRRRGIAAFESLGDREIVVEHGLSITPMGEFRDRMRLASELISDRYPEWYWLWRSVLVQIFEGRASAGHVDYRELAVRAGLTTDRLHETLKDFIQVCVADPELADLVGC